MYGELVKELRDSAEWADRLALLMGRAEGDAHAPVMRKAADAIEELSKLAETIPHKCECCVGCELEKKNGGCDHAFVLSPKRAMQYLIKPRWIPVTERLPETPGEYMVAYHPCYWDRVHDEIKVGLDSFRGKTSWAKKKYQRVTHWMPLPPAPKEE